MRVSYIFILLVCSTILYRHVAYGIQSVKEIFEIVTPAVVVVPFVESDPTSASPGRASHQSEIGYGVVGEGNLILTTAHAVRTGDNILTEFICGQLFVADMAFAFAFAITLVDIARSKRLRSPRNPPTAEAAAYGPGIRGGQVSERIEKGPFPIGGEILDMVGVVPGKPDCRNGIQERTRATHPQSTDKDTHRRTAGGELLALAGNLQ